MSQLRHGATGQRVTIMVLSLSPGAQAGTPAARRRATHLGKYEAPGSLEDLRGLGLGGGDGAQLQLEVAGSLGQAAAASSQLQVEEDQTEHLTSMGLKRITTWPCILAEKKS